MSLVPAIIALDLQRNSDINAAAQALNFETFGRPLESGVGYHIYGALAKTALVGVSNLFLGSRAYPANICQVAVDENYRGQGAGSALITYAIDVAAERGYESVSIHPLNEKNARLYSRLGFMRDDSRPPYLEGRMFLDLSRPHPLILPPR